MFPNIQFTETLPDFLLLLPLFVVEANYILLHIIIWNYLFCIILFMLMVLFLLSNRFLLMNLFLCIQFYQIFLYAIFNGNWIGSVPSISFCVCSMVFRIIISPGAAMLIVFCIIMKLPDGAVEALVLIYCILWSGPGMKCIQYTQLLLWNTCSKLQYNSF